VGSIVPTGVAALFFVGSTGLPPLINAAVAFVCIALAFVAHWVIVWGAGRVWDVMASLELAWRRRSLETRIARAVDRLRSANAAMASDWGLYSRLRNLPDAAVFAHPPRNQPDAAVFTEICRRRLEIAIGYPVIVVVGHQGQDGRTSHAVAAPAWPPAGAPADQPAAARVRDLDGEVF